MEFCARLLMGIVGFALSLVGSYLIAPVFILDPAEFDGGAAFDLALSLGIGSAMLIPGWLLLNKVFHKPEGRDRFEVMPDR